MDKPANPSPVKVTLSDRLEIVAASPEVVLCAPLSVEAAIGLAAEITHAAHDQLLVARGANSKAAAVLLSQAWGFIEAAKTVLTESHGRPSLERLN